MKRAGRLALALALVVLGGAAAHAQTDYLPDNSSWNGLSVLCDVARGMQRNVRIVDRLDWTAIGEEDTPPVLLLVYPRAELDTTKLLTFLTRGGNLLIADDFGRADALLAKLGIQRHDGKGIRARLHYDGNRNLPIALPGPASHELIAGVRGVITNHPAYFRSRLPTLLGFRGARQQLLVAGQVGRGRFVALADPSVLINAMVRFRGNLRLATNVLRFLAPDSDARVLLVTGFVNEHGKLPAKAKKSRTRRIADEFSKFVGRINDFALTGAGMRALAFVLGALALAGLIFLLPVPRKDLDGRWLRPSDDDEPLDLGADSTASAAAAALREEVEERLTRALDAPGPISTIHPRWLLERVKARSDDHAATLCSRLLGALKQVPYTGPSGESLDLTAKVSKRELANIYTLSQQLLRALEQPELPSIQPRDDDTASPRRPSA